MINQIIKKINRSQHQNNAEFTNDTADDIQISTSYTNSLLNFQKTDMDEFDELLEEVRITSIYLNKIIKDIKQVTLQTHVLAHNSFVEARLAGCKNNSYKLLGTDAKCISVKSLKIDKSLEKLTNSLSNIYEKGNKIKFASEGKMGNASVHRRKVFMRLHSELVEVNQ